MIERRPDYYPQFHCLAGACPDTCCRDWSVVPDEEALADYIAAPSPLRERITHNLITDDDGDVCFRLDEKGMCSHLTPDGLCAIQRDWGKEHLCAHCAAYPRFTEEYGCLTETALAISCPEAARLLLEAPRFALTETDDGVNDPPFEGVDGELLAMLEESRAGCLDLLSRWEEPLWGKLQIMLARAGALQKRIYARNGVDPEVQDEAVAPTGFPSQYPPPRLLEMFIRSNPLRPDWPQMLKECAARLAAMTREEYAALRAGYERENPRWERQLTNLACYLVFRHWHKAVNDNMLYGRAALVWAACTALYHLALFRPGEEAALLSRFSREVEHDADCLDMLIAFLPLPDPPF